LDYFELGNLDAKRDWGFAKDYVEGMWKILQVEEPDTYVLATNKTYTVRDFVKLACKAVDIDIDFKGKGIDEIGVDVKSGKEILRINPKFYRPAEVDLLIGDNSNAKKKLGWSPKTELNELCEMMVSADMDRNKNNRVF